MTRIVNENEEIKKLDENSLEKEIKEVIKNWENIKWNFPLSIEHIKFLISRDGKQWEDFASDIDEHSSKKSSFARTQVIKFLLAKDEIQEKKIKELESEIKSLKERVSLNYRMLTEENQE